MGSSARCIAVGSLHIPVRSYFPSSTRLALDVPNSLSLPDELQRSASSFQKSDTSNSCLQIVVIWEVLEDALESGEAPGGGRGWTRVRLRFYWCGGRSEVFVLPFDIVIVDGSCRVGACVRCCDASGPRVLDQRSRRNIHLHSSRLVKLGKHAKVGWMGSKHVDSIATDRKRSRSCFEALGRSAG